MSEIGNIYIGDNVRNLSVSEPFEGYSHVILYVDDDEKQAYTAGNADAGRSLELHCPWANQAMANQILEDIQGFEYQPFDATGALIPPHVELGDAVTVGNVYAGIYKQNISFSRQLSVDVSAPADEEVDHEFPYEPATDRIINRKIATYESEFRTQSDKISADVRKKADSEGGDSSAFGWKLTADGFVLYSANSEVMSVNASSATIHGRVEATEGYIGSESEGFSISSNAIESVTLTDNVITAKVYIGRDKIALGANENFKVDSSGNMTARNATLTGTLTIGGQTITASNLRSGAQSAYDNSATWTSGAAGGIDFSNMSQGTFKTRQPINASTLLVDGVQFYPQEVTFIDGVGNVKRIYGLIWDRST